MGDIWGVKNIVYLRVVATLYFQFPGLDEHNVVYFIVYNFQMIVFIF